MRTTDLNKLLEATGLKSGISHDELIALLGLQNPEPIDIKRALAELDAMIETAVIAEVDTFTARAERDAVLIRFMSEDDFALYEPELFEQLKRSSVHGAYIARAKRAIERLGGEVTIAFMESTFYETWLGINDFDDSRDLRVTWARQQIRGLSN